MISSVLYQMENIEIISYLHSYDCKDQQNAAHILNMWLFFFVVFLSVMWKIEPRFL